ncbi:thaumatin [Phlyctochytrium arcticum]|nr:thaumatin [Phlyctochytrium arcticum]
MHLILTFKRDANQTFNRLTACGPDCYKTDEKLYSCTNGKLGPYTGESPPSGGGDAAAPQPSVTPGGPTQTANVPSQTSAPPPPTKGKGGDPGQTGPPIPRPSSGRTFELVNKCPFTVWPGILNDPAYPIPEGGGFELPAGSTKQLNIPSIEWKAARIWPRTGCREENGQFKCATGDCGGLKCNGKSGERPATLAEFTLQDPAKGKTDFYDVSNVDGHNIGLSIETYGDKINDPNFPPGFNCGTFACTMDMQGCPPELQWDNGSGGIACASIGTAVRNSTIRAKFPQFQQIFNNPDTLALVECACDCPQDKQDCKCGDATCKYGCSPHVPNPGGQTCDVGKWPKSQSPGAGTQFPAEYEQVFKKQCPESYSWQFDDFTSTYQCFNAAYRVVFCPLGR